MKGRKPKLTVVDGDSLPARCPAPPSWLSKHAKAEWRRVAPILHSRNLLSADTMGTLEAYAMAIGMMREAYQPPAPAQSALPGFGKPAEGQSPAKMKAALAAMREARLLAAELGLTPHRRGGASGSEKDTPNDGWDRDLLA